ncbi:MAG: hypothetical protein ACRDT0_14120 [Pseudonocardiaceae bacterium]
MAYQLPHCPPGAGAAGKRLWRATVADYELPEHELLILKEAVRTADLLERLEEAISTGELTVTNRFGEIVSHPAIVEARQQRQRLASLLASLRLPDDEGDRPQRRGAARGTYGGARGRATGRRYGMMNDRVGNGVA